MNINFLKKMLEKVQLELSNIVSISSVLNRQFDNASLVEITSFLQGEINSHLVKLVTGNTDRIRAIRDMAILEHKPELVKKIDTSLKYCHRRELAPQEGIPNATRVMKLELLRLAAINGVNVGCESNEDLIKHKQYRFIIADNCVLMSHLIKDDYIKLECVADLSNGYIRVASLHCATEGIDLRFYPTARDYDIGFDYSKIFLDFFTPVFDDVYFESDYDMIDFKTNFEEAYKENEGPRSFIVHVGDITDENGGYPLRRFSLEHSRDNAVQLIEHFNAWPSQSYVCPLSCIPYMVAIFAKDYPDETNFRVTYDAEHRSVSLIPGDPYASDH